jgi:hypothetical protein
MTDAIDSATCMDGKHIHKILLSRIERLMDAKGDTPEGAELAALAEACQVIEEWLFP